jgi:hypothetical protein
MNFSIPQTIFSIACQVKWANFNERGKNAKLPQAVKTTKTILMRKTFKKICNPPTLTGI